MKAGVASEATRLTPRPPSLIGKLACNHCVSVREELVSWAMAVIIIMIIIIIIIMMQRHLLGYIVVFGRCGLPTAYFTEMNEWMNEWMNE